MIIYMKYSATEVALIALAVLFALMLLVHPITVHAKALGTCIENCPPVGFQFDEKMHFATTTPKTAAAAPVLISQSESDAEPILIENDDAAIRAQLLQLVQLLTQYLALLQAKTA